MPHPARVAFRAPAWLRDLWWAFRVALVVLVVAEACAWLWVRIALPPQRPYDERNADALADAGWVDDYWREYRRTRPGWESYVYWRRRPLQGEHLNIDADGKRRSWRDPRLAAGASTIFVNGGSTVWGRGARDDFTIPSWIAKTLAAEGVAAEVVNLGQGAYVHTQDLLALILELRAGRVPDVVVFYGGINDVFAAYQSGVAGVPQNEWRRRQAFEYLPRAFLQRLVEERAIFRLFAHYVGRPRPGGSEREGSAAGRRALARDVVGVIEGNMHVADALGRSFGFAAHFYWQPVIFSKPNRSAHENEILEYTRTAYPGLEELFADVDALLRSGASRARIAGFRDLTGVFGTDPTPYYIDFAHISGRGNRIVAAAVAADLGLAELRERRRSQGEPAG